MSKADGGETRFADLVWKPIALCNFEEFRVYDFDLDTSKDTVATKDLPE